MSDSDNLHLVYQQLAGSWKGMGNVMKKSVTHGNKKGDLSAEAFVDIGTHALHEFRRNAADLIDRLLKEERGADAGGVLLLVQFGTQRLERRISACERLAAKQVKKR